MCVYYGQKVSMGAGCVYGKPFSSRGSGVQPSVSPVDMSDGPARGPGPAARSIPNVSPRCRADSRPAERAGDASSASRVSLPGAGRTVAPVGGSAAPADSYLCTETVLVCFCYMVLLGARECCGLSESGESAPLCPLSAFKSLLELPAWTPYQCLPA